MKVVDIADELYRELSSPKDLSIAAIGYWLRTNIGQLNNQINTTYKMGGSPDYEIQYDYVNTDGVPVTAEITEEAKSVLKKMYMIHYYENKLRANLAAAETDSVISVADDGSSIRKINKNEVSKVYLNILKTEIEELKKLIYAFQRSHGEPLQVAGDDTESGYFDPDRPREIGSSLGNRNTI